MSRQGQTYRFKRDHWGGKRGTVVYCVNDDGTRNPWFSLSPNGDDNSFAVTIEGNLQLITEGGDMKPTQRKTYKLLKELPELKKGALLQEKCDDGTQDFKVLDEDFVKYTNEHGHKDFVYPRQAVENEPSYFVEVFPVTPQYMTQTELDLWDAFQKAAAKPTTRKPRAAEVAAFKATRGRKVKKAA